MEVRTSESRDLGVVIGMDASGEERIVAEVDPPDDVRGTEGDLLGLGEEIVRVPIQHHLSDRRQRHQLLRNQLGRIQHVEAECLGLLLGEQLEAELPLRKGAGLDGLPEIAPVEIGISARDLHRFVPVERVGARHRVPVEFDEGRFAFRVDQPEGVDSEALHHPIAPRDGAIGHRPHEHMGRLGHQRDEVPERVVRGRGLGHSEVRLGFGSMDEVRKLHRVLNEEDRDVVADQIPDAFVGIELHREPADVARRVGRAALADHRGEADEDRRALAGFGEDRRRANLGHRAMALEIAVRPRAARVDDALGDPLVIEVGDLLTEDEVLQQRRPTQASLERALVVGDGDALVGRQGSTAVVGADTIEGQPRGALAESRLAGADLRRRRALGEGAPGDHWARRLRVGALLRRGRCIAVFARLRRVEGHRRGERPRFLEFVGERLIPRGTALGCGWPADGSACTGRCGPARRGFASLSTRTRGLGLLRGHRALHSTGSNRSTRWLDFRVRTSRTLPE